MSNPTINILIGPNEQQRDAIVRGLRNQPYNAGCLLGRHMVAIRQVPRILAAPPKSRQALAAELGRRLTAAKPEELRNMQELLNKTVIRRETESYGFLGLKKRAVTKRYTEPRPSSQALVALLRGEAYDAVYRRHWTESEGNPRYEDQCEDYLLITASGRFLEVRYTLNWDYNLSVVFDVEWFGGPRALPDNNEDAWIYLVMRAAQVLGDEAAEDLCKQYV